MGAIIDQRKISAMNDALSLLKHSEEEWSSLSCPPEVEWPRMRSLDLQEALRALEGSMKKFDTFACIHDPDFEHKVRKHACSAPQRAY